MRFPKKKVSPRATAIALALGVVGVLLTALPASAAAVTSFSPICGVAGVGAAGTTVTITGTGFTGATDVTFNGGAGVDAATFAVVNDTTATATVPVGASTGTITVQTAAMDTPSAANFTVVPAAAATITSFTPTSGAVGSSVAITGTNFCGTTAVLFNTTNAPTFVVNSPTSITATVPVGATSGALHVTTPSGTANSAGSFTVVGVPTVTSFTPTSGNVGTSVTITGTNLLGVTAVRFNGVTATFTTSTATSVTAVVPSGATTGRITVTTAGGTATSATDFTVTTAPVARVITFGFEPNSRVSGQVSVASGLAACRSLVPVIIQRQKGGSWKWVDTTATRKSGSFKTFIPPNNGNFRARLNQITLANGVVCGASTSSIVRR